MKQRGRQSAAKLEIASIGSVERPKPPADLTKEQAEEWWAVAGRLPADWFKREHFAVLAEYCRHVSRSLFLSKVIDAFEAEELSTDDGLKRYNKLTAAAERETRAVLGKIREILAEIDLGMDRVVRVEVHLTDLDDFDAMDSTYLEFFDSGSYPARTTTESKRLFGDSRVEITCQARL